MGPCPRLFRLGWAHLSNSNLVFLYYCGVLDTSHKFYIFSLFLDGSPNPPGATVPPNNPPGATVPPNNPTGATVPPNNPTMTPGVI